MLDQAGIFMAQGKSIACERISGVNDNMVKSHYHNYYELYFLESGERLQRLQDHLYQLRAGDILLFSPYIMHFSYGEKDVPFRRILLYFHRDAIDSPDLLNSLDSRNGMYRPTSQERTFLHQLLNQLLEEQSRPGPFQDGCMHALLNLFLYQLIRVSPVPAAQNRKGQNRIGQIIQYIHSHYDEDLSLDQLSQRFYISPYHLCREFKQYTNSTLVQYINATRIMNAQRKFMETDKSITQISKETGFSNLTHFNRVFKSVTGMTPSGYRKTHENQEFSV